MRNVHGRIWLLKDRRGGSLWWTAPYLPTSWLPASQILSCQTFLFLKSNWLEMSDKQNGIYHTINSWHIIFIYYLFYFRGLSPSSHIIYFPSHSICSQPKILNICTFNPTSLFLFVYVCVRIFKKNIIVWVCLSYINSIGLQNLYFRDVSMWLNVYLGDSLWLMCIGQ